jgi:uncharacterized protein (TIGR03437 family)
MRVLCSVLAAALPLAAAAAAPFYTAESVAHAANHRAGPLAPNTIVSLYGTDLSWGTAAASGIQPGGRLPTALPNAGVHVTVGGTFAPLYYVSPRQVNFLAPAMLKPGTYDLELVRDGQRGPKVRIELAESAPGLFHTGGWALATRASGALVTPSDPAVPGEVVVLYGTGFGQTSPPLTDGLIPRTAAWLPQGVGVRLEVGGLDASHRVFYAGVTPGFAGLYQINLLLPDEPLEDPEIVLKIGSNESPQGVRLPVRSRDWAQPMANRPRLLSCR